MTAVGRDQIPEWDPEEPPMGAEIDLWVINFPHDGSETQIRPVEFGPASKDLVVLIEVDANGEYVPRVTFTIGNGPANQDIPVALSNMLHEMADIIESAGEHPDFLDAVAAAN